MKLTTPFIIASLPFMALAGPIAKGFSIPISKRGPALTQDGVVNMKAINAHLRHVAIKYNAGLKNDKKDTSLVHHAARSRPSKSGAVALTGDDRQLWYGIISVGTPPKDFTADFDTGSSDPFLPDISCNNCGNHTRYDPCSSSTSSEVGKTFRITYADNSTSSGVIYTDTVTVAGLTAKNQSLGSATDYSTEFQTAPMDGLLGLAWPGLSTFNSTPFFHTLIQQRSVKEPVFAFHLSDSGSSLRLGGTDESLYRKPLTYSNVTRLIYWEVHLDGINVGQNRTSSHQSAVIDTGTTLIVADPVTVGKFYQAIKGSAIVNQTDGITYYSYPCNSDPQVSVTLNNVSYSISSKYLNFGQISEGSSDCFAGVAAIEGLDLVILGDAFLQNVYAVFDVGNTRVGIAELSEKH
ncbi:acid protease [Cantharellus anzutake]|uniref:acid protease n=1 Tax=Cantharellus anzutake TaxID=1750568 RepID=UPI0019049256|nr:acid protease [Cantharellus anzutake]KAF8325433.1 acid protease [Cantharellus anzutake]